MTSLEDKHLSAVLPLSHFFQSSPYVTASPHPMKQSLFVQKLPNMVQLVLQENLALTTCPFTLSNSFMHLLKRELVACAPTEAAQQC